MEALTEHREVDENYEGMRKKIIKLLYFWIIFEIKLSLLFAILFLRI